MKELSDNQKKLIKQLVDHFDQEDRAVRERQLRIYKKLKYYWNGFQRIWWSEAAHDWRISDVDFNSNDDSYYDKPVNIFRSYLESIIAALSVTIPAIKCYPDDADNPDDLQTASVGDNIAKLIYKHNDVSLLWLHALYIYCTEGLIACYNYTKESEEFGTYSVDEYEDVEEIVLEKLCPLCQTQLQDDEISNQERNEFDPSTDDTLVQDLLKQTSLCPNCLVKVDPETRENRVIVTRLVGTTHKPKARQCLEVYGGLFVKVPNYAKKQEDIPYLIFSYETHYSNMLERYPHLKEVLTNEGGSLKSSGLYEPYEQWARLSTQYFGEYPTNTITVRNCWFRPSAFNILSDDDDVKELKKNYPNGLMCVFVNDEFAEARNENLDDHWTLTHNPLSDYLTHDPLGLLLTSIQEITNDLVSLTLQTIEHGIPQTFVSPDILDFDAYRQLQAAPGMIIPTKPATGKNINEGFHTEKTAILSGEVLPFSDKIQQLGQMVSGAQPSLFGGVLQGSKTASEYSMARSQALQRLQTPWKMLTTWWKTIFGKVIASYLKDVLHDEKMVSRDKDGNFVNIFIRRSQLSGKIGSVELETSEQLPITWSQQRDIIMQLLTMNNPMVIQALTDPDNLDIVKRALGINDFTIPGVDDREKQYEEIKLLLQSEPMIISDSTNQEHEAPSVDIEPIIDNNEIHADICRKWLVSSAGRLARVENPLGYRNVMLHMQRHLNVVQAMMAMNAAQMPQQPITNKNKAQQMNEEENVGNSVS